MYMFETLGSYSRQTVYMSMQNGSHLEIQWNRILIHTLELKLRHFSHICLYREAMRLQCFPPTRYVKNGESPLGARTQM